MTQTLEERVEKLERQFSELTIRLLDKRPCPGDWQQTFGLSRGDEGFEEMARLGREYRESLRHQDNSAGS
ncbi:MAG: hypothetical protein HYY24_15295 [Verrucomicrobia bacterium]|nr:hypothetical protein [Verrucomicrobiota bacterium]